jgi:hypothetical protein
LYTNNNCGGTPRGSSCPDWSGNANVNLYSYKVTSCWKDGKSKSTFLQSLHPYDSQSWHAASEEICLDLNVVIKLHNISFFDLNFSVWGYLTVTDVCEHVLKSYWQSWMYVCFSEGLGLCIAFQKAVISLLSSFLKFVILADLDLMRLRLIQLVCQTFSFCRSCQQG